MKKMKSHSMLLLILVFVIGVTAGCVGQKFNAVDYTKSCLDAMYKGEFEEYTKITNSKKEDAQKQYDENVKSIVEKFEAVGLSEELLKKYESLFRDLLRKTKYTVKEAKKDSDGNFTVSVEIEQMQIFDGVMQKTTEQTQAWAEELTSTGETIPTLEEINEKCFQIMYDLMAEKMKTVTYGEKQVVTVKVKETEKNVYSLSEKDFEKIDAMMYDVDKLADNIG